MSNWPVDIKQDNSARASNDTDRKNSGELRTWGWSVAYISQAQKQGMGLLIILDWLVNKTSPGEPDLLRSSPEAKSYWLNKEQFLLIHGVIYQKDGKTNDFRLVMPMNPREGAIASCHNLPSSGTRIQNELREKDMFVSTRQGHRWKWFILLFWTVTENAPAK